MSKSQFFIDSLTAQGKIAFTQEQFCSGLGISHKAATNALSRLLKKGSITSPGKGYYLILTPEFMATGCLPADYFIDYLMQHCGRNYYVGLLSAALYHGAAHQQLQNFQVMVDQKRKTIHCGNVTINFIQNNHCIQIPKQKIKTRTGYMFISTPEATAMDLLIYMRQSGGMPRIVTVIEELAEVISKDKLINLARQSVTYHWVPRLGYLLEFLGYNELADSLYDSCFKHHTDYIPLVPYATMTQALRDKKWRLAVNAKVESDLNDTY